MASHLRLPGEEIGRALRANVLGGELSLILGFSTLFFRSGFGFAAEEVGGGQGSSGIVVPSTFGFLVLGFLARGS